MKIKIVAPKGKMLRDLRTENQYSEVICDEKYRNRYVLADSEGDPTVEYVEGTTLAEKVAELNDTVTELSEKVDGDLAEANAVVDIITGGEE